MPKCCRVIERHANAVIGRQAVSVEVDSLDVGQTPLSCAFLENRDHAPGDVSRRHTVEQVGQSKAQSTCAGAVIEYRVMPEVRGQECENVSDSTLSRCVEGIHFFGPRTVSFARRGRNGPIRIGSAEVFPDISLIGHDCDFTSCASA